MWGYKLTCEVPCSNVDYVTSWLVLGFSSFSRGNTGIIPWDMPLQCPSKFVITNHSWLLYRPIQYSRFFVQVTPLNNVRVNSQNVIWHYGISVTEVWLVSASSGKYKTYIYIYIRNALCGMFVIINLIVLLRQAVLSVLEVFYTILEF